MKNINNEIKLNLFKSKYLTFIFILHLSLIFTLIGIIMMNIMANNASYNNFYNIFKDNEVFNVIDIGDPEVYSNNMNMDNIDNISDLYEELNTEYTRIGQIINQFDGEFDVKKIDFMNVDLDRIESYEELGVAPYKSLRVNKNFFDLYQLNVTEGTTFSVDYKYNLGETIPVILGNAYKDYYNIGDQFKGDYFLFEKNSLYEVIGFLDSKAKYFNLNLGTYVSLDHYILVPDVDINKENAYREEVIIANYAQRIPSVLLSEEANDSELKDILDKYGLSSMYRVDNQKMTVEKIYQDSKNLSATMLVSFIFLSLFSVIIISMNCFRRISMNFKRYAIHLANGASTKDISKLVLCDLIVILITSDIVAIGINTIFALKNVYLSSAYISFILPVSIVVVAFSMIIYLTMFLIVKIRLNKFKIVDFIRRLQP